MQSHNGSLIKSVEKWISLEKILSSYQKQSPVGAFKQSGPRQCKKKKSTWTAKSEILLAVSLTICEMNEMHL